MLGIYLKGELLSQRVCIHFQLQQILPSNFSKLLKLLHSCQRSMFYWLQTLIKISVFPFFFISPNLIILYFFNVYNFFFTLSLSYLSSWFSMILLKRNIGKFSFYLFQNLPSSHDIHLSISSVIHLFIQQVSTEPLPCAGHCLPFCSPGFLTSTLLIFWAG